MTLRAAAPTCFLASLLISLRIGCVYGRLEKHIGIELTQSHACECFDGVSRSQEAEDGPSADHVIVLGGFLSREEVSRVMGLASLSFDSGLVGSVEEGDDSMASFGDETVRVEAEMHLHDEELFDKLVEGTRRVDCMAWCTLERRPGAIIYPQIEVSSWRAAPQGEDAVPSRMLTAAQDEHIDNNSLVSVLVQLSSSRSYQGGDVLFDHKSRINIPGTPTRSPGEDLVDGGTFRRIPLRHRGDAVFFRGSRVPKTVGRLMRGHLSLLHLELILPD